MEQIKSLLGAREDYLLQIKKEKEEALQCAPEGALRICCRGDKTQYYLRNDPKDFNGVYLREKELNLAKRLAQKDYDKRILSSIEKELQAIRKYFASYPCINAEEIYGQLHKSRQELIKPIVEKEEQYICNWQSEKYQGKEFDEMTPEIYTAKGERVRSKSEVIIADLLNREGIPYRYECPVRLKGWGWVYPDFTVLHVGKRKEIYWEHLGMMDDSGYVENALQKIALYEQNGIFPGKNLILTYETKKNPINQKIVKMMIQQYILD